MCSVIGAESIDQATKMLKLLKHRAPDDEGVFFDGKYAIGMGRLAILDTSKILTPYKDNGLVLSYNGEIYNYIELRQELKQKGHYFATNSDTEVLLASYKEWGSRCLQKFNGMFAFVIYDGKTFFMARDIAGEKPLYYQEHPFRFASEAKALDNPIEFPPASYGVYERGKLKIRHYWNFEPKAIDIENPAEQLEELLEDSIKLRTRSDVPYALYRSGGVDSSLISTFHKFDVEFTYEGGDKKEFLKLLPKIVWHLDYPISSFSPYCLWKLAELASRSGIKVVLSGEGADELFGGYVRYVQPHFNYLAQQKFPSYKTMFTPAENVNDAGWKEFNGNLRELLRQGDRMSSAFGIENRCPFLDKRIIEFAFSLPYQQKINGVETKVILNKILKKRMPEYQPIEKHGLVPPVNEWLGVPENAFDKEVYLAKQREYAESLGNQE